MFTLANGTQVFVDVAEGFNQITLGDCSDICFGIIDEEKQTVKYHKYSYQKQCLVGVKLLRSKSKQPRMIAVVVNC